MRVCTRTSDERICGPGWVGLLTRDVSDTVLYSEPGGWKLLCTRGHSWGLFRPGGGASARASPQDFFGFIGRHNTDDLIISMVHASREHPCARIWNKGLTCGYGHGRDGQARGEGIPKERMETRPPDRPASTRPTPRTAPWRPNARPAADAWTEARAIW